MKRLFCLWASCLLGLACSTASYAQDVDLGIDDYVWGQTEKSADTTVVDPNKELVNAKDTMPTGRFEKPVNFTRREINKVKDPRVQDIYWYALNDQSDQKRYYKAHYSFNQFRDNWSFMIGGGIQCVEINGLEDQFKLGPQVEFALKKDIHPYWSTRVAFQLSNYEHYVYTAHESTFIDNWGDRPLIALTDWDQKIKYTTATGRIDAMLNVLNICAGRELLYNPFDFYVYLAPGMRYSTHKWGTRDGSCFIPFWSVGALAYANVNSRLSFYLDLNASWQGDDLEGYSEQCSAYKFDAMLGISYKISKMRHFMRLGYDDSDLRNELQEAYIEGDKLASYVQNIQQDTVINVPAEMIQAAFFQIDRIELAHTYVLNLGFYADMIKACPTQKFIVRGFADTEVGSSKRNLWLSQKRAEVVYDVLVKDYGVNPDQLVVGGGDLDVELPFMRKAGHHRFNRCTIVCPMQKDYQVIKTTDFDDPSELMDGRVKGKPKNY